MIDPPKTSAPFGMAEVAPEAPASLETIARDVAEMKRQIAEIHENICGGDADRDSEIGETGPKSGFGSKPAGRPSVLPFGS